MTSFQPKFTNLVAMLQASIAQHGPRPLFGIRQPDAEWRWISYAEFGSLVDRFRGVLAGLGVGRGDKVAVIANNRLEWAVGCYATYGRAAAYVPMYEAQLDADWQHILGDSDAKVVLVANEAIEKRVQAFAPDLKLIVFDRDFEKLVAGAQPGETLMPADSDIANLIYTSGTTGKPKGVMLTHRNLASNVCACAEVFPLTPDERSLAFLPWAHVAGGSTELHGTVAFGASAAICEKTDWILESLPKVQPTWLLAVPRIWNRIFDGVNKQIAGKPKLIQMIFHAGLRAQSKKKRGEPTTFGESIALPLARVLIFKKVKAKFGGRLKYACSGAAALSKDVAEFIDNLGIDVFEAYGMTESSSVATLNRPGERRIGSVGKAAPGVTIKLDTEVGGGEPGAGEIVIYGHGVMAGYHNQPEETAKVLTPDGGLRSGDLGRLDQDGFLFITGRVKEIYKLENGKYVAPAPLEEKITLSPFIAQAFVHGMNKPFNVAILVPDMGSLADWAKENGLDAGDPKALVAHDKVRALLQGEIERYAAEWKGFERVQDFVVVPEEFSVANDLLTPTLKVKRRNVIKRYEADLEALYRKPPMRASV